MAVALGATLLIAGGVLAIHFVRILTGGAQFIAAGIFLLGLVAGLGAFIYDRHTTDE
jgi:hypothetical protein